eukprot:1138813-Pelagomonas_calceolata.AAC.4
MEQPCLQQASVQDVSEFLLQHNNKLFPFVSELMDIMLTGEDQSQADQPNSLAKGPPVIEQAKWNDAIPPTCDLYDAEDHGQDERMNSIFSINTTTPRSALFG